MKNKLKLYLSIILMLLSTCFLTGCQLARESNTIKHSTESLCGLFVTVGDDRVDSFVNQEVKVNSKGEIEFSNTFSNNIIEGIMEDGHVKFGDIPGYYMGLVEVDLKDPMKNCYGADNGFKDVNYAINSMDGIEDNSYKATISVSRKTKKIININPVYVRADGSIYTVLGQSVGYMNTGASSGQIYSETLSDEKASTQGGVVTKEKKAFTINVAIIDEAKQVLIKEMNQDDSLIKTTIYSQKDADDFVVDPNTSYVIVEELMTDISNKDYIARSVYSLENKNLKEEFVSHSCSFPGEGGVIGTKTIRFIAKDQ